MNKTYNLNEFISVKKRFKNLRKTFEQQLLFN